MTARFACFEIDPERRRLTATGQAVHLTPKAFDLLWLLLEAAPRVVTKRQIHDGLWNGGAVSDATIAGLVKEIRRAIEPFSAGPVVRTVHRIGFAIDVPVTTDVPPARAGQHWLVVNDRRLALVDGANVIGRDPAAALTLDQPTLSRRHACIHLRENSAVLEDLGSKNGTWIQGAPVKEPTPLRSGDEFICGRVAFRYVQAATAQPTETSIGVPGSA